MAEGTRPVQALKARENAVVSLKPSRSEISRSVNDRSPRRSYASSQRQRSFSSLTDVFSSLRRRFSVATLNPSCRAICSVLGGALQCASAVAQILPTQTEAGVTLDRPVARSNGNVVSSSSSSAALRTSGRARYRAGKHRRLSSASYSTRQGSSQETTCSSSTGP